MSTEIVVLGCGSSAGTPVVGCECQVCTERHPRNVRTRSSCFVRQDGVSLLIDTGPDMRQQALREDIRSIDAVLYTHPHADHLNGIDDLRAFCFRSKQAIPLYGNAFTMRNIEERFGYTLMPPTEYWERPVLTVNPVDAPFQVKGATVIPIPVLHGQWPILGYRIGNMAWLTDVSSIPDESRPLLEGLEVLFLDSLRQRPHYTHMSIGQAVEEAQRIRARETWLIHMTHDVDVPQEEAALPDGIRFAYDGLRISLES